MDLRPFLTQISLGRSLDQQQAEDAFNVMMSGDATPAQMGALLMGMRVRGETEAELTGAARAMRAKAVKIKPPPGAIDTCGTGGGPKGTLNISTAVALVVAGAGVPVAKHGNRAASSTSAPASSMPSMTAPAISGEWVRMSWPTRRRFASIRRAKAWPTLRAVSGSSSEGTTPRMS